MAQNRVGGLLELKVNGALYLAKGNFTYNLGHGKREAVLGAAAVHGYMEKPQVAFIEGEITDTLDMDLKALVTAKDATVQATLGNGKIILLSQAWYAGEGTGNTEEGNVGFRFESRIPGDEVR